MRLVLSFIIFIFTVHSTAVHAGREDDFAYLSKALQDSHFKQNEFEQFQNPQFGHKKFRLSEARAPWAGNYFPMKDGGIAQRWQGHDNQHPSIQTNQNTDHYLKMSVEEIRKLSPIEKYDLLNGDYKFSATKTELINRGPYRDIKPEYWEGFCNGVRCAGINLTEPRYPIEVTNPDGIKIIFEPADLKALAGASYFYVEKYAQMGSPTPTQGKAYAQPNPAVFDLALRYFLGKKKKSFVIDAHLGDEIWNESVIGFQRHLGLEEPLSRSEKLKYSWAKSKILVQGHLEMLGEIDIQDSNQPTEKLVAGGSLHKNLPISYYLFLDENGLAKDGYWINQHGNDGVDFMWFGAGKGADADYHEQGGNPYLDFKKIRKLFKMSSVQKCQRIFN